MIRLLCIIALCVGCKTGSMQSLVPAGDDFITPAPMDPVTSCAKMDVHALPQHAEQADFNGNTVIPLQVGLVFVAEDNVTDAIVSSRLYRLYTAGGVEIAGVDARATAHWPNGNIKWLWLRFNDKLKRTPSGYTFYWGISPACKGPDFDGGTTIWASGSSIHLDTKPGLDCKPDGTGCSHDGDGVEAVVDLAGGHLLDTVNVDGVAAVTQGIKPILEGQKRTDSTSDYRTQIAWVTDATEIVPGRAGAELRLQGEVVDEETSERVAWLEVVLDVRRDFASFRIEHSITWLREAEPTEFYAWESSDSSVDLDITCGQGMEEAADGTLVPRPRVEELYERKHSHTIGRLGLLIRSDPGAIESVSYGDCSGTGEGRACANNDRVFTESVTSGAPLVIRQQGPRMYTVNDAESVSAHLSGGMTATGANASIEVAVQHFWQTYPSGFEVRHNGISIDLYPDWAPDWTFSFHEEDGSADAPLVYKPLPGHDVPGETTCIRERSGISVMDFYTHFLHGNLTDEGKSTGCVADHLKRGQVIAHGAGRTHQLELAFYTAAKSVTGRGVKRASMLNHPVILRQDPAMALRVNFLGLQMVPVHEGPEYQALEDALEAILYLNSLRFMCRHDFGFWHFGKAQGHYGLERLDRWVDGIQYGHQAIPWLLFIRGGSRDAYEQAIIQSRHAFDVPINKHYLDPDWDSRVVSESDFSASPFNWGKPALGLQTNINFLAFYHHLGGQQRVRRLLQAYAADMKAPYGDVPLATHKLAWRNRSNFVPNAMWAILNEEVGDDRDLADPELATDLQQFEARWLQRTFSIDDDGTWGQNYFPQAGNSDHERYDAAANGTVSPFAYPNKGLERGLLAQWARGNLLDAYWSYLFDHTQENGFVSEIWRGLNRVEAIQLGPMLSTHTGDALHARRSWTHADRIARTMPQWDDLVADAPEPGGDIGDLYPMQTQWFNESHFRDLTHGLLAGITARAVWDPELSWSPHHFHDTVFQLVNGCAHAWIRAFDVSGAMDASFMIIADSNADVRSTYSPPAESTPSWTITVDVFEKTSEGVIQSVLTEPIALSQPGFPEYYKLGEDYLTTVYQFPPSFAQSLILNLEGGQDYLVTAKFTQYVSHETPHVEDDLSHHGFFQIVALDPTQAKVVHERPVGTNLYHPIGFASHGVTNHTKYDHFTGATAYVKLLEPGASGLYIWDMGPSVTEPFSFRDADGQWVRLNQTATWNPLDSAGPHMKKRVQVIDPPVDWLELTTVGQGTAQLGVYGYDTYVDESYTKRSDYVPATMNTLQWFEPNDTGWRDEAGALPGCF